MLFSYAVHVLGTKKVGKWDSAILHKYSLSSLLWLTHKQHNSKPIALTSLFISSWNTDINFVNCFDEKFLAHSRKCRGINQWWFRKERHDIGWWCFNQKLSDQECGLKNIIKEQSNILANNLIIDTCYQFSF